MDIYIYIYIYILVQARTPLRHPTRHPSKEGKSSKFKNQGTDLFKGVVIFTTLDFGGRHRVGFTTPNVHLLGWVVIFTTLGLQYSPLRQVQVGDWPLFPVGARRVPVTGLDLTRPLFLALSWSLTQNRTSVLNRSGHFGHPVGKTPDNPVSGIRSL